MKRELAVLEDILDALGVDGRALEPLRLLGLADYLESIEHSRGAVTRLEAPFPILRALVETVASFRGVHVTGSGYSGSNGDR